MSWASEFYAGKTVVVVGGSSGIGLGVATAFREAAATVHATGATDAEVSAAEATGGVNFTQLDVRDAAAVATFAAGFDTVSALVYCAGINLRMLEFDLENFETVLDVNLTGAMRVASAFRPKLRSGAFLSFGSVFSTFGSAYAPAYTASKTGLIGLTRSLGHAFAGESIRVNAIAGGWFETPMTAVPRANPTRNAEILSRLPIGRWGTPDDVAPVALFLCSPLAGYITGAVVPVDGGYLVA